MAMADRQLDTHVQRLPKPLFPCISTLIIAQGFCVSTLKKSNSLPHIPLMYSLKVILCIDLICFDRNIYDFVIKPNGLIINSGFLYLCPRLNCHVHVPVLSVMLLHNSMGEV